MSRKLAIIPARGGSKRIPSKNIKPFYGKPMIAYSIEAAVNSGLFDKVIVSTDSPEIAEVAKKYGAEVPFMRPAELSGDHTVIAEVVNHALDFFEQNGEKFDFFCTIFATAPFISMKYLKDGLEKLENSDAVSAFSCTSMPFPFQRSFKVNENGRTEMFFPENYFTRSQDLEEAYQDAGQFYWTNIERKKQNPTEVIFGQQSIGIIIPRYLVQDIDTEEDWKNAEVMYQAVKEII